MNIGMGVSPKRKVCDQVDGCVTSRMAVRTTEWVCDQYSYKKYDFC